MAITTGKEYAATGIGDCELCRPLLERYPALLLLFLTARSDDVDRLPGLGIGWRR
ncbi:hypothetical protein QD863_000236 [Salmonella enterica]|nr:hypothetical protein [Salmonella enterica]EKT1696721.1 hypothetical protein [Salmonella enterica]EKT3185268.1 hypothetical protein [Salmonella enterica]